MWNMGLQRSLSWLLYTKVCFTSLLSCKQKNHSSGPFSQERWPPSFPGESREDCWVWVGPRWEFKEGWDEKELLSWVLCCEWGNLFRQHQHMGVREALPDHRPALIPSSFPKEVWEAGRGRKHSKPLEEGLPEWILALVLDERLSSGEEMQMKDSVFSYDTE